MSGIHAIPSRSRSLVRQIWRRCYLSSATVTLVTAAGRMNGGQGVGRGTGVTTHLATGAGMGEGVRVLQLYTDGAGERRWGAAEDERVPWEADRSGTGTCLSRDEAAAWNNESPRVVSAFQVSADSEVMRRVDWITGSLRKWCGSGRFMRCQKWWCLLQLPCLWWSTFQWYSELATTWKFMCSYRKFV